jgi:hypothetical protein
LLGLNLWSAKKHVFGGVATVAGMGRQTLACALAIMVLRKPPYS